MGDSDLEYFLDRLMITRDCWFWIGSRMTNGYGRIRLRRHHDKLAHRFSYEWFVGPIPKDLELDHLCRNPACVNPDHLEAVPHSLNIQRGRSFQRNKTTDPYGHTYDGKDILGRRFCYQCKNAANRRYKERHRARR